MGSDDIIRLTYYDKEETSAGGISIVFGSPVSYELRYCNSSANINLPEEMDRHWVIEKRGYTIVMFCNGRLVVNTTLSNEECGRSGYEDHWRRDGNSITVSFESGVPNATAVSQSYYIGWYLVARLSISLQLVREDKIYFKTRQCLVCYWIQLRV